ncbi:MAG: ketopantoate reductase family protein [Clostridia bacterium]|nr:ketopantoate reductase family protein [Clostridia bacterium]
MQIKTVSIIGLGSLGMMYGHHLSKYMPFNSLRIIAGNQRILRYQTEGVYCNGECCNFNYRLPQEKSSPADLVLFTVKFKDLPDAIEAAKNQVGPDTILISLLNGIGSEELIAQSFGINQVIYSVAQGMDATKIKNNVEYHNMGLICFGSIQPGIVDSKLEAVRIFFDRVKLPYELILDMRHKLWGKFMLNVGVNQAVTVFECDYGGILKEGIARDTMIAAMEEVLVLSDKEGVHLTQADLDYWLRVLEGLSPIGKPSMRQDIEAKRKSEVELFAGAVLDLSKKHHIVSPVNQMFYDKIKEMETDF